MSEPLEPCTAAELEAITAKVRPAAQIRALRHLGIDCRRRADGSVLVLRSAVKSLLDPLAYAKVSSDSEEYQDDWEAFRKCAKPSRPRSQ